MLSFKILMDKEEKSTLLDFLEIVELIKKGYYHSVQWELNPECKNV